LFLFCGEEKIGTLEFELTDFLSDRVVKREMYKVFSGRTLPILSWGLKFTLGIMDGGIQDMARLKLTEHKHIYLASSDYHSSEALPEEWLTAFEETDKNLTNLFNKSELKSSRYSVPSLNQSMRKSAGTLKGTARGSSVGAGRSRFAKLKDMFEPTTEIFSTDQRLYSRNMFNEERPSITPILLDRELYYQPEHDENRDAVNKILVDTIQEYEHGGKKPIKKQPPERPKSVKKVKSERHERDEAPFPEERHSNLLNRRAMSANRLRGNNSGFRKPGLAEY
jgi:hypothetical protein